MAFFPFFPPHLGGFIPTLFLSASITHHRIAARLIFFFSHTADGIVYLSLPLLGLDLHPQASGKQTKTLDYTVEWLIQSAQITSSD